MKRSSPAEEMVSDFNDDPQGIQTIVAPTNELIDCCFYEKIESGNDSSHSVSAKS